MLRKNKGKLILSSIIIVFPILVGIVLWDKLPDTMAIHWGSDGEPNGFSSKAFVVFGFPIILLALQWICLLITSWDNKQVTQSLKALGIIYWIVPAVSVFANAITYSYALGQEINVELLSPLFCGLMFIYIGNYMPKIKLNHTLGIKIKWTLESEENWNKTHRFAGKIWVIGGAVILLAVCLPETLMVSVVTAMLIILVLAPIIYSYVFYKQHEKRE